MRRTTSHRGIRVAKASCQKAALVIARVRLARQIMDLTCTDRQLRKWTLPEGLAFTTEAPRVLDCKSRRTPEPPRDRSGAFASGPPPGGRTRLRTLCRRSGYFAGATGPPPYSAGPAVFASIVVRVALSFRDCVIFFAIGSVLARKARSGEKPPVTECPWRIADIAGPKV